MRLRINQRPAKERGRRLPAAASQLLVQVLGMGADACHRGGQVGAFSARASSGAKVQNSRSKRVVTYHRVGGAQGDVERLRESATVASSLQSDALQVGMGLRKIMFGQVGVCVYSIPML